jgi:serine/threonine protein phosphatase PrpC
MQDVAWRRHEDERWIVGDPGRQHEMVPYPADLATSRPDTTIDGANLGQIEYRAVSLRGFSHWGKREPRQDAYLLRISANGQWLVGCVADGVGQSKYAHMAADIACREITGHIVAALDEQLPITAPDDWRKLAGELPWQQAVEQANAAMMAKASTGTRESGETGPLDAHTVRGAMATTAVGFAVAAVPAEDGQLPFTLAVAAGDSSALILSEGRWDPITAVKNAGSDVASNDVLALPRDVEVAPVTGFLPPGAALVVVTDGIGDPMGSGTGEVGQFLAAHWSRPPDLFAFAAHAAFYRRGFTDDRTAVAVWHKPGAEWPDELDEPGAAGDEADADEARADDHATRGSASDPLDLAIGWSGEEGNSN